MDFQLVIESEAILHYGLELVFVIAASNVAHRPTNRLMEGTVQTGRFVAEMDLFFLRFNLN